MLPSYHAEPTKPEKSTKVDHDKEYERKDVGNSYEKKDRGGDRDKHKDRKPN